MNATITQVIVKLFVLPQLCFHSWFLLNKKEEKSCFPVNRSTGKWEFPLCSMFLRLSSCWRWAADDLWLHGQQQDASLQRHCHLVTGRELWKRETCTVHHLENGLKDLSDFSLQIYLWSFYKQPVIQRNIKQTQSGLDILPTVSIAYSVWSSF